MGDSADSVSASAADSRFAVNPDSVLKPRRGPGRYVLYSFILIAVFGLGLLTARVLAAPSSTALASDSGMYMPVGSRQLTVTLQPLKPSARIESLLPAASSSLATARELAGDNNRLAELESGLAELYPFSYRTAQPLEIPDALYDFERQQYDTSELLDWLKTKVDPASFKTVGLLYCDVYDEGYNFLFGQARITGPVCVVSASRMGSGMERARLSAFERWRNIVRHELGHTLGLQHVADQHSVMAFGNSLEELDGQGAELTRADWRLLQRIQPIRWEGR